MMGSEMIKNMQASSKKVLGFVCAIVIALALCCTAQLANAQQAYADDYRYTVTLYAGDGTINGASSHEVGTYAYGDKVTINLDDYTVVPNDARYEPNGIYAVGQNHDNAAKSVSFEVTSNKQYIVDYSLTKGQADYTINFVDANGNELMESQTITGAVGDKPVFAFQYIEGYQPQSLVAHGQTFAIGDKKGCTVTLTGNKVADEFTLVYEPVAAGSTTSTGGSEGTEGVAGDGATEGEGTEGAAGEEVADPANLIDIDDEANPLAGSTSYEESNDFGLAEVLPWVLGVLVAAAVIAVIALAVVKKRSAKQDA